MASTFPTTIDSFSNPVGTDKVANANPALKHGTQHANANDAIEAIEAKLGANGSAVTTSHDYKLGEVTGSDKAVSKTATQTLTNKTLTSPVINQIINTGTLSLPTSTDTLVGRATTDTLTNKTLTSPTITTPTISSTGFTNAQHAHTGATSGGQLNASSVFSTGTIPVARLGLSGTPDNTTYLRGDNTWQTISQTFYCGDGSDGNVTISIPTTLTRDMYYNDLTVTSTLTTAGYKIFVKGTLSGAGTIDWGTANAGSNGGFDNAGSGAPGGNGGASSGNGQFVSIAGSNGGAGGISSSVAGTNGLNQTSCIGGVGSAGGAGYSGSAGGTGGTVSIETKFGVLSHLTLLGVDYKKDGTFITVKNSGGAGGGGGSNGGGSLSCFAGGGGGGASGGTVSIVANTWAGTFTIKAVGGAGGAGGNALSGGSGGKGGGGGGGGRGGNTVILYNTKTWTGSYNIAGGAGGTGGTGSAGAGTAGTAGGVGTSYEINFITLTR